MLGTDGEILLTNNNIILFKFKSDVDKDLYFNGSGISQEVEAELWTNDGGTRDFIDHFDLFRVNVRQIVGYNML